MTCNGDMRTPDSSSIKSSHVTPTTINQPIPTDSEHWLVASQSLVNLDELTIPPPVKSMSEASITIVPISPVPISDSVTRKPGPPPRPPNYQPQRLQPANEISRQKTQRQTSDSGISSNGGAPPTVNKTPTVHEIIERQKMQSFQRQLSQPVTKSSTVEPGQSAAMTSSLTARTSKSLPRSSSTSNITNNNQQRPPLADKRGQSRQVQHPPTQARTMQPSPLQPSPMHSPNQDQNSLLHHHQPQQRRLLQGSPSPVSQQINTPLSPGQYSPAYIETGQIPLTLRQSSNPSPLGANVSPHSTGERRNPSPVIRYPMSGAGTPSPITVNASPFDRNPSPRGRNASSETHNPVLAGTEGMCSDESGEFVIQQDISESVDNPEFLQQLAIQRRREMAQHNHPQLQQTNPSMIHFTYL